MSKLPLILIGGGGHCRSCIDVIEQEGKYAIQGIVDANLEKDEKVVSYPVIGNDEVMEALVKQGYFFLITIGQIKSAAIRVKLFNTLKAAGANLATIISPRAYVSSTAEIKEGTIVLHGAVVNAAAKIGHNVIINSMSLIEHDAHIGSHVHISTGALVNGGCLVGDGTFVGSGTVVAQGVNVGSNIIIGAGSLVIKNIETPGIYAGGPVKKI